MQNNLVSQAIENFRQQLIASFQYTKRAFELDSQNSDSDSFEDYFNDWAQVSWELLVERVICQSKESLEIYADGSDYERAEHSRVFYRDMQATHKVICIVNAGAKDLLTGESVCAAHYEFDRFVDVENGFYILGPRFDYVLLNENNNQQYREVVVCIDQVKWQVLEVRGIKSF